LRRTWNEIERGMVEKEWTRWLKPWIVFGSIALVTVVITLQNYLAQHVGNGNSMQEMTSYTNYLIFKNSFLHLISHQDMYQSFPGEHADLYKYSPTFAILMAPFAMIPDFAGLLAWNILNMGVLFLALWRLPMLGERKKLMVSGFVLIEAITAISNSQSNCLLCGILVFAFLFLEKGQIALASLMLVLSVYIKLFGLIGFVLFLFYPNKGKAFVYCIGWFLILGLLPLMAVSVQGLSDLYKSWWVLLETDHSISYGFSAMAWLHIWFGWSVPKNLLALAGLLIFSIPLIRYKQFEFVKFRILFLASVLLWVVLFNHKAESPSFVIAVSGVAIWFFSQKYNLFNLMLLFLTFFFTELAATDIYPESFRDHVLVPYVVKVVPCIFVWLKLNYDLLKMNGDFQTNSTSGAYTN
jgi:hypothetical protein